MTIFRWKYKKGNNEYNNFIPEVDRPSTTEDVESQELQPGDRRNFRGSGNRGDRPINEYSRYVHEWVIHLRRVHSENPPVTINDKVVKASNPLAELAPPRMKAFFSVHSKTAYYNLFFFEYWDECFIKTFGLVCPFYE